MCLFNLIQNNNIFTAKILGCENSYSGDKKRKMLRCVFLMAKCEIGRLVPVQMKLWSGTFLNIFIKWNIVGLVTNVHSWEYLLRSHTRLSPVWIATPDNTPSIFRFWVGVGRLPLGEITVDPDTVVLPIIIGVSSLAIFVFSTFKITFNLMACFSACVKIALILHACHSGPLA